MVNLIQLKSYLTKYKKFRTYKESHELLNITSVEQPTICIYMAYLKQNAYYY